MSIQDEKKQENTQGNTTQVSAQDNTSQGLWDIYQQRRAEKQAAIERRNQKQKELSSLPDAPGTTYEDIIKSIDVPEPTTPALDPKKEKSRNNIMNIADAISAMSGIVGASLGADVAPAPSLSTANKTRYDKLVEQRKAEQDAYNRALMQRQSHALSLADSYRRRRQQEEDRILGQMDSEISALEQKEATALENYNRQYKSERDAASDARSDRSYYAQQARDANSDQDRAESHNAAEEKKWKRLTKGMYVAPEDYEALVRYIYKELRANNSVYQAEQVQMDNIDKATNSDGALSLMEGLVNKYLSSPEPAKAKIATDAAKNSKLLGEPDFWEVKKDKGTKNDTSKSETKGPENTAPAVTTTTYTPSAAGSQLSRPVSVTSAEAAAKAAARAVNTPWRAEAGTGKQKIKGF